MVYCCSFVLFRVEFFSEPLAQPLEMQTRGMMRAAPIDSDEQEKILISLNEAAIRQSFQIRNIFFYLYLAIAGILLVCLFYTIASPFQMQHQKHFEYLVQIEIFYLFYVSSAYTFMIGALIAKVRRISAYVHRHRHIRIMQRRVDA
jgi:hypothetical protein